MRHFHHIHSSGRFDRSPESLATAVKKYLETADILTGTEVDFEPRKKALREAVKPTHTVLLGDRGHADDSYIAFDNERFELLHVESFQNTNVIVHRTDGHVRDPAHSRIAVLLDKTTKKVLAISVSHYASNVQAQVRDKRTTYHRVLQWRSSTRNSKRRLNKIAKQYNADARLLIGDWNVDYKLLWVRALIKAFAPRYKSTWRNVKVAGGTHGRRIIDATLLRGSIKVRNSAELYADDASSDHRPYVETLIWR